MVYQSEFAGKPEGKIIKQFFE